MKKIEHAYLIDDNEFVLMISEKIILNHTAFEKITSFTNGLLALNTIIETLKNKGQLPTVIFLDLNMPAMSGWAFLDAISVITEAQDIAVYLFTALKDIEDIKRQQPIFR